MADIILGQHFILHFCKLIKIKLILKFWTRKSIVSLYCILKNLVGQDKDSEIVHQLLSQAKQI